MIASERPVQEYADYAQALGFVVHLAARTRIYGRAQLALVPLWIEPAIWLGQVKFLFDAKGRPVSYFTYAYLTLETEKRFLGEQRPLSIIEWREGERFWVMDMVCLPGYLRPTLQLIERTADGNKVYYLRRGTNGVIRKVISVDTSSRGRLIDRGGRD